MDPVAFRRLAQPSAENGAAPLRRVAWSAHAGDFVDTAVIDRTRCPAFFTVRGPALMEEPESTVLVPAGWSATTLADGAVELLADEPVVAAAP